MSVRDITLADTFYVLFTTRAFATGVPGTLAGTPVVSAYENESTTQITAGITLGVDHDSVTGLNLLTVVATGANGYEAGKDYALVITTGTVGGVSVVGEVVAEFTIGRSAAAVDLANGTDGLGALLADILDKVGAVDEAAAAGDPSATESVMQYVKQIVNILAGSAGIGTFPAAADPANGISIAEVLRRVFDDTDALNDPTAAAIANAVWDEAVAGHVGAGTFGKTDADILADTNELQSDDIPGTIGALNDISTANVNSEVSDVMKTDAVSLPGQGAPSNTPTMEAILGWLYKAFRNRKTQTSTLWQLMADNETTVDSKATVSDDGTTAIKQEIESGA